MTPSMDRKGRLDLLVEDCINKTIQEFGQRNGIVGLENNFSGLVKRFVSDNFPAEAVTPEAIAEKLGLIKKTKKEPPYPMGQQRRNGR